MADIGTGEGASVDPVKEDFKTARRKVEVGDVEAGRKAVSSVARAISGTIEQGNSSDDPEAYELKRVSIANELGSRRVRYLLAPPEQAEEPNTGMVFIDVSGHEITTNIRYLLPNGRVNPYYKFATNDTASMTFPRGGEVIDVMDTIGGIYDSVRAHGVHMDDFTVVRDGDVGDFIDKFPFSRGLEPSEDHEVQQQFDIAQATLNQGRIGVERGHRARLQPPQPAQQERPALDRTAWSAVTDRTVESLGTNHEELANFLQTFADAADSTTIGYGNSNDYEMMEYCGPFQEWVRFVDDAGNGHDRYALLRRDMQAYRRPQAPDEFYTIVNMRTGDELRFAYSDIEHIRQGVYVRETPGQQLFYDESRDRINAYETTKRRVIDPRLIAAVAGITEPYDDTDPIIRLTRGRQAEDGVILDATFQTKEQIDRFTRLVSLNESAAVNARATFAPPNAEELIRFASESGSDWIAPHIQTVVVPEGTTPMVLDDEHRFALDSLMNTVSHWDADTQRAIYRSIQSVDISALGDAWAQGNNIRKLIYNSIRFGDDGSYTVEPSTVLTGRLLCDQYDFLEGVYKAANGMWVESMTQNQGEARATWNPPRESLDEYRAEVYAKIFGWRLMNSVDAAREAYGIPDDIPDEEQIVMLLKRHGYTEKGMRLSKKEHILAARHNITVPQWGQICMIIDRCREAPIGEQDRTRIEGYGFSPDAIARYLERGPGSSSEQIAELLARRRELT